MTSRNTALDTRKRLRRLREKVREDDGLVENPEKLLPLMEESDGLLEDVRTSSTGIMDAKLFKDFADVWHGQVRKISCKDSFRPTEFVTKLSEVMKTEITNGIMQPSMEKWIDMGQRAQHLFARPPSLSFLYGSLPEEIVEKQPTQRRRTTIQSAPQAPTKVTTKVTSEDDRGNSIARLVTKIHHQFETICQSRNTHKIGFFHFTVDPTDFCQTIENMFLVSFLIKDKKVLFKEDEENPELISLNRLRLQSSAKKRVELSEYDVTDSANVSITMEKWEEIIKKLNISEAMIKL